MPALENHVAALAVVVTVTVVFASRMSASAAATGQAKHPNDIQAAPSSDPHAPAKLGMRPYSFLATSHGRRRRIEPGLRFPC
jgi:hypothetical protein